jgi:hypothetical protein
MKARVRNRLPFIGLAVFALVLLASMFQTVFWSRDSARARALHEVTQFCLHSGRDPALLSAPREDTVGNATWSFEWHYDGKPRYLVGVWFSHDGHPELYSGNRDDPESAAYDPH